jgi:long-subunit fatty acid transport protein
MPVDAHRLLPTLALVMALVPSASAQVSGSLTRAGSGARAAGMGNAFIAVADDGTAVTWNPAGLAQLRKPELSLVLDKVGADVSLEGFRSPDGRFTYTRRRDAASFDSPEFASLAIPVGLRLPTTFQIGWRRLYLIDNRLDVESRREPTALAAGEPILTLARSNEARGSVDVVSVAAATRLTSRLSFGASWDFWQGVWQFREARRETLAGGPTQLAEVRERNHVTGDSLSLGLLFHYPRWRVGVVYHSPVLGSLRQSGGVFGLRPGESEIVEETEVALRFPTSLGFGSSWKPRPHWTLAADMTWDEWREWTVELPDVGRVNLFDGRPPSESSTRNTLTFNAGTEWILRRPGHFVPLRIGFSYEPQGTRDPVLFTGYALKLISVGTGYNSNRFKFDAALQFGWFEHQVTEAMQLETIRQESIDRFAWDASGLQREQTWRVKVSAILRLTDTDKLKRTLGRLFGGGGGDP